MKLKKLAGMYYDIDAENIHFVIKESHVCIHFFIFPLVLGPSLVCIVQQVK